MQAKRWQGTEFSHEGSYKTQNFVNHARFRLAREAIQKNSGKGTPAPILPDQDQPRSTGGDKNNPAQQTYPSPNPI
jgi:hypothetical protein